MEYKFLHNQDNNRFELIVEDRYVAVISYVRKDDKLILNHTGVPDELSGKGIGKILASKTFELIKQDNLKALATCSYLVALIKRNPEWSYIEICS